jgi:hypothetical protein
MVIAVTNSMIITILLIIAAFGLGLAVLVLYTLYKSMISEHTRDMGEYRKGI